MEVSWDFFQRVVWPLILGYAMYIHNKLDSLRNMVHNLDATSRRDYATRANVSELENKLTAVLNRIDDKVTRILERDRNG